MIEDKTLIIIAIIGLLIVSFLFFYVKQPEVNQIPKNLRKHTYFSSPFWQTELEEQSTFLQS